MVPQMSDRQEFDPDDGKPYNGVVGDQVYVEGTPQDEWQYRTTRECWSPAAWAASAERGSQLVLEHVTPLNIHVDQLIAANGDKQETRAILHAIELVVITKDEDRLVTKFKWGQKIPDNGADGYQRYLAAGLQPDTFIIPAKIPQPSPEQLPQASLARTETP